MSKLAEQQQFIVDALEAHYARHGVYPSTAALALAAGVQESAVIIALVAADKIHVYSGRRFVAEVVDYIKRKRPSVFEASRDLDLPYAHVLGVVIVHALFSFTSTMRTKRISIRRAMAADVARKSNKVMTLTEIAAALGCTSKPVNECLVDSDVPYRVRASFTRTPAFERALALAKEKPGVYTVAALADAVGIASGCLRSAFSHRDLKHLLKPQRIVKRPLTPRRKRMAVRERSVSTMLQVPLDSVEVLAPVENDMNKLLRMRWSHG